MMSVYSCKTKKDLRGKVGEQADGVLMETSIFGPELRPEGSVTVVGPGPYERKWYASVIVQGGKIIKVV